MNGGADLKSLVNSPAEYEDIVIGLTLNKPRYNDIVPERFIRILKSNQAAWDDLNNDGMPKKNPLIVALGDSVTAGAFEGNTKLPPDWITRYSEGKVVEYVFDIENVYHERFRRKLAQKYCRTTVSVINSGMGGDNVAGMNRRLERDVIRYLPDLVIVNAVLNGPCDLGEYEYNLREIVDKITAKTAAEIVLMTPNLVIRDFFGNLDKRVGIVRSLAVEKELCIADAFAVWEQFEANGIDIVKMLSNGINHPTKLGHEVFALELMKLFE